MGPLLFLFSLIPFYAIGLFPTGYLVARKAGIALESAGSGNVGATNVARVLGKKAGIQTLFGDVTKGALGVAIARLISTNPEFIAAAAFALVAGHCFSIPGKLKGGKGVATALGAIILLDAGSALFGVVTFALVFAAKRIVSLASICAALLMPVFALLLNRDEATCLAITAIGLLVVWRHKANLTRLMQGTEPKFSSKK